MKKPRTVGIVAHAAKPEAREAVEVLSRRLKARGVDVLLETETAELAGGARSLPTEALSRRCSVLAALGGDGTILRLVAHLDASPPPVFGINIGSLGFLSGAGAHELAAAAASLANGSYTLSSRALLCAEVRVPGKPIRRLYGLNDVVISRGERSELVKIEVTIEGLPLTEYNADGLIVATPTGSTAYSLSAGGPVLMPESGCFVITPICPHVLTNRSTVVSDRSDIVARITRRGQHVFASVDGRDAGPLPAGASIRITRSRRILRLAMLPGRSFADILRQKLKWSGSNV
jgi:NAD+ kinase